MKFLFALLSSISALISSLHASGLAWPQCNGVLPTAITASSTESGTVFTSDLMIDGILSQGTDLYGNEINRWNSDYNTTQSITLSYPSNKIISQLYIEWDKGFATQGSIQYSPDGTSWYNIQNFTNSSSGLQIITLNAAYYAKYLRLNLTQGTLVNGSFWGYSIREIQGNSTTCATNTSSQLNNSSSANTSSSSQVVQGKLAKQLIIPLPTQNTLTSNNGTWTSNLGLTPTYKGNAIALSQLTTEILQKNGIGSGSTLELSTLGSLLTLGEEGYELIISSTGIQIISATKIGLYYGLQSLNQMLASHSPLNYQTITDKPSQSWRGVMLDLARNFMPLSYLKSTLDRMGALKLNRLHLHLSDDQGWRIEIKSWPKLQSVGSQSSVGGAASFGYLTQDQYSEIVTYAQERGIAIVPEIDIPGHTNAMTSAYPDFKCGSGYGWPYSGTNVGVSAVCYTPQSMQLIGDVLAEVSALTPTPWIHVGGDEVAIKTATPYNTYIQALDSITQKLGKTMIGWEEITQNPSLSSNSIWQKWQGSHKSANHKMINSDCRYAYIDHREVAGGPGYTWCGDGVVSELDVYSLPSGTLGVEATLWGEMVPDTTTSIDRLYPRIVALSEAAWSDSTLKNYTDFTTRKGILGESWFTKQSLTSPIDITPALVQANKNRIIPIRVNGQTLEIDQIPTHLSEVQIEFFDISGKSLSSEFKRIENQHLQVQLPQVHSKIIFIQCTTAQEKWLNKKILIP